ncbi:CBS domain-containing protein [Streptomyces sp. JNUCC 63]
MNTLPASVPRTTSLEEAAQHMARAGVGALPVVDDDRGPASSPTAIWSYGRWRTGCHHRPKWKRSCSTPR